MSKDNLVAPTVEENIIPFEGKQNRNKK